MYTGGGGSGGGNGIVVACILYTSKITQLIESVNERWETFMNNIMLIIYNEMLYFSFVVRVLFQMYIMILAPIRFHWLTFTGIENR